MAKPLKNNLALVTGSSRGICAAIAIRLAADGASVIVNYAASPARAEAVVNEIRKAGGQAEAVGADLSSTEGIKTLISSIDEVFGGKFDGRLDILVNNAGSVDRGSFLDSSDQTYDKHFDLNVRPVVELSKDAAKRMVKAAAPVGGVSLYIATKFAVHGFTRALSRELGPTGITVNGIQPPSAHTPGAEHAKDNTRTEQGDRSQGLRHSLQQT